jgi:hypothetical protein
VNIKRVAIIVILAVTCFSVGLYSQARQQPPDTVPLANVPVKTYSGDDLGYTVTSAANGRIEGTLVIRVNGNWIPIQTTNPPAVRGLQGR